MAEEGLKKKYQTALKYDNNLFCNYNILFREPECQPLRPLCSDMQPVIV